MSAAPSDALRPRRRNHLIARGLDGETLLYDPVARRTHRLNPAAAVLWQTCDGRHSVDQLAAELTRHFEVAFEVALRDVRTALRQLEQENLLAAEEALD